MKEMLEMEEVNNKIVEKKNNNLFVSVKTQKRKSKIANENLDKIMERKGEPKLCDIYGLIGMPRTNNTKYFCYNCSREEMCEECYNKCHGSCNKDNKKEIQIEENEKNTRIFCCCSLKLEHPASQTTFFKIISYAVKQVFMKELKLIEEYFDESYIKIFDEKKFIQNFFDKIAGESAKYVPNKLFFNNLYFKNCKIPGVKKENEFQHYKTFQNTNEELNDAVENNLNNPKSDKKDQTKEMGDAVENNLTHPLLDKEDQNDISSKSDSIDSKASKESKGSKESKMDKEKKEIKEPNKFDMFKKAMTINKKENEKKEELLPTNEEKISYFASKNIIYTKFFFEKYFQNIKYLTDDDFTKNSIFDLIYYKNILINNFAKDNIDQIRKFLRNKKDSEVGEVSDDISSFMKDKITECKKLLKFYETERSIYFMISSFCLLINFCIKYFLLDKEALNEVIRFISLVTDIISNNSPSKKVEYIKHAIPLDEKDYLIQLFNLLYYSIVEYNTLLINDYLNNEQSETKFETNFIFCYLKNENINENEDGIDDGVAGYDLGTLSLIAMLRIISQINDISDSKILIKKLKDCFFIPFNNDNFIYDPTLYAIDEKTWEKYSCYDDLQRYNNDIYTLFEEYYLLQADDQQNEKYEQDKISMLINKLLFDENHSFSNLYNYIKEKLPRFERQRIRRNNTNFNKNQHLWFENKNEYIFNQFFASRIIDELVSDMTLTFIDTTVSKIIEIIFNKNNELITENFRNIDNLLDMSLNILSIFSSTEIGMKEFSIGNNFQVIKNIIWKENNERYITDNYMKLFRKLCLFYSTIPIDITNDNLKYIINDEQFNNKKIIYKLPLINNLFTKEENIDVETCDCIIKNFYKIIDIFEDYVRDQEPSNESNNNFIAIIKNIIENIKNGVHNENQDERENIYFNLLNLLSNIKSFFPYEVEIKKITINLLNIQTAKDLLSSDISLKYKKIIIKAITCFTLINFQNPFNENPIGSIKIEYKENEKLLKDKTLSNLDCFELCRMKKFLNLLCDKLDEITKKLNENPRIDINRIEEVKEEIKEYCKELLLSIFYASNFIYTSNNIHNSMLRDYELIYHKLSAANTPFIKLFGIIDNDQRNNNNNNQINNADDNEEEKELLQRLSKEISIHVPKYSSKKIYEKVIDVLRKFFTVLRINKNMVYDTFIQSECNSFSSLENRYKFLFNNNLNYDLVNEKFIEKKYFKELIDFLNEKIKHHEVYVFNKLFNFRYLSDYVVTKNIREHYDILLFSLLDKKLDDVVIMFNKIFSGENSFLSSLASTNFLSKDYIKVCNKEKSKEFINFPLQLMKNLKNKLFYYTSKVISISKIYSNIYIDNNITIMCLHYIKICQEFLENFNCSFQYYLFEHKFNFTKLFEFNNSSSNLILSSFREKFDIQSIVNSDLYSGFINQDSTRQMCIDNDDQFHFSNRDLLKIKTEKKLSIIDYLLIIFDITKNSSTVRRTNGINLDILCPGKNLSIIFSAIIDFLIESFSTFNNEILVFLEKKISKKIHDESPYNEGIFSVFKGQNDYDCVINLKQCNNINLFITTRIFDFLNVYLLSVKSNFTLFDLWKEDIKNGFDIDLTKFTKPYFMLILYYFRNLIKNLVKCNREVELGKRIMQLVDINNPDSIVEDDGITISRIKFIAKCRNIYKIHKEFRESMEMSLIIKIFLFIKTIEKEFDLNYVSNQFDQVKDEIREQFQCDFILQPTKDLWTFYSNASVGTFIFLSTICRNIEIVYNIPKELKDTVKNYCLDNIHDIYIEEKKKKIKEKMKDLDNKLSNEKNEIAIKRIKNQIDEINQKYKLYEIEKLKKKKEKLENKLSNEQSEIVNRINLQIKEIDQKLSLYHDKQNQTIDDNSSINSDENDDSIEVNKNENDEDKRYIFFLQPFYSIFVNESKTDYLFNDITATTHIDKCLSLIKATDYFTFEMLRTQGKIPKPLFGEDSSNENQVNPLFNYEKYNFYFIAVQNLILLSIFYKGTGTPLIKYDKCANINYFIIINWVICLIHCIYFIWVPIYNWFNEYFISTFFKNCKEISKRKFVLQEKENKRVIDYDNYKKQHNSEQDSYNSREQNKERKDKLEEYIYNKKFDKIKNIMLKDYYALFREIFTNLKPRDFARIGIVDSILINGQISILILTAILNFCFILTLWPIFLVVQILFFAHLIDALKDIFFGIQNKWKEIFGTFCFTLLVLYFFMWFGFWYFSQFFVYPAVDFNNADAGSEPFCSSTLQCMLIFLSKGLFEGGTSGMIDTLSYRNNPGFSILIFFYHIFSFLLVSTIFANVFTGLITDSFGDFRKTTEDLLKDKDNRCFICNVTKEKCSVKGINFKKHTSEEHNRKNYLDYLCYLHTKDKDDFTSYEKVIWEQLNNEDISWIPYDESDDEGENDD